MLMTEGLYLDNQVRAEWLLVTFVSGAQAVVSAADLELLLDSGRLSEAVAITLAFGRYFEEGRARAGYMSVTCRLKSGESGGVG
jgi:hypothetical protein